MRPPACAQQGFSESLNRYVGEDTAFAMGYSRRGVLFQANPAWHPLFRMSGPCKRWHAGSRNVRACVCASSPVCSPSAARRPRSLAASVGAITRMVGESCSGGTPMMKNRRAPAAYSLLITWFIACGATRLGLDEDEGAPAVYSLLITRFVACGAPLVS